ncbi:unnamed protein product, partial [marine sediment metagenome]
IEITGGRHKSWYKPDEIAEKDKKPDGCDQRKKFFPLLADYID